MAGRVIVGMAVTIALASVAPAAGDQLPILRSAAVLHRHVVVGVSVSDLRPVQLTVATRRGVDSDGALIRRDVRLRETIQLPPFATGVVRWQSRARLVPGVYFVQVMAVDTGGVTDCPHFLPNCLEHWSNVRRVLVARSG